MQKLLFGIFAHPDDEGFGPSGTLLKMAQNGTDVHLICITRGDAGSNPDNASDLGALREQEWRNAGALIGAKSMHCLGFKDGTLSNNVYHEIASQIETIIRDTIQQYDTDVSLECMTFDTTGLSGHLDHIATSMIAHYVFVKLRQAYSGDTSVHFKRMWQFCIESSDFDHNIGFVYAPAGRLKQELHFINDVSDVLPQKLAIMQAHHSQRADADWHITHRHEQLKKECFRFAFDKSTKSTGQEF